MFIICATNEGNTKYQKYIQSPCSVGQEVWLLRNPSYDNFSELSVAPHSWINDCYMSTHKTNPVYAGCLLEQIWDP